MLQTIVRVAQDAINYEKMVHTVGYCWMVIFKFETENDKNFNFDDAHSPPSMIQ